MVDRILIAPGVAKLSKVGIDVKVASNANLLFNGDNSGAAKFFRGSVSGSRSSSGTNEHVYTYDKTFSIQPFVLTNLITGSGWKEPAGTACPIKAFGDSALPMTDIWYAGTWVRFEVKVGLSSVRFRVVSFGPTPFSYTIDYQILDYRIGF